MANIINASIECMDAPDYTDVLQKIERCGRVCYKSEDKITDDSAEQFVRGIIKRGHESVLEHVTLSVRVVCDRGVSHEIVRHRIASYSQESTRYCNYTAGKFGGHITVIDPATGFGWDLDDPADVKKWKIWHSAMYAADRHYREMIEAGATAQEARSVLPNSLKTEIVMTMNLREWRHFFRLRCDKAAHPQMREIACLIDYELSKKYPVFFEDLETGGRHALPSERSNT
jgi:thymidylate synthase (FAD)